MEDMVMEDMVMEDMVMEVMDMDVDTMARERLKQSQDILEVMEVMDMAVDMEVMAMDVDTMAKGKQMQNLDILEGMVDMAMVVMAMAVDMVIMVEYLSFLFNPSYNFIGYKTKGIKHELVNVNFFLLETFICVTIDKTFKHQKK